MARGKSTDVSKLPFEDLFKFLDMAGENLDGEGESEKVIDEIYNLKITLRVIHEYLKDISEVTSYPTQPEIISRYKEYANDFKIYRQILSEGNSVDFEYRGYKCHIRRRRGLYLCGYVEIPETNKLYGRDMDDELIEKLEVHGGVTWADEKWEFGGKYVIGFDCNHLGDWDATGGVGRYVEMIEAIRELENLVDQIIYLNVMEGEVQVVE